MEGRISANFYRVSEWRCVTNRGGGGASRYNCGTNVQRRTQQAPHPLICPRPHESLLLMSTSVVAKELSQWRLLRPGPRLKLCDSRSGQSNSSSMSPLIPIAFVLALLGLVRSNQRIAFSNSRSRRFPSAGDCVHERSEGSRVRVASQLRPASPSHAQ